MEDEGTFIEKLYSFMSSRGTPIVRVPIFDHRDLNLYRLYKEVTSRGGVETVIMNKMWRSVTNELSVDPDRTDAGFRLRTHYLKYLYPYERRFFLGLSDDDFDFAAFERMLTKAANSGTRDSTHKGGRGVKSVRAETDDMHSESHPDGHHVDHMPHYAYSLVDPNPFEFNPAITSSSPTIIQDQTYNPFTTPTPTNTYGNRGHRNGARGAETQAINGNASEPVRIGTRSRTGARVTHSTVSSPDEKEIREVEKEPVATKGRTKRARTERREALLVDSESTHVSLASNFAKLDLGALKKYKQYHQMRLDTSANKSEIIEAVSTHFSQQHVDEAAIIRKFVAHVKSEGDTRREREARRRHSKVVRA